MPEDLDIELARNLRSKIEELNALLRLSHKQGLRVRLKLESLRLRDYESPVISDFSLLVLEDISRSIITKA